MRFAVTLMCALMPLLASTASASPADSSATPDPRVLITQVITAYGGRAAWEKISVYRMEGRVVTGKQGREGPTTRLFQRAGRLRVELHYPDRTEMRIVSLERGWRGLGSDVQAASGPMLDAMILQASRADLPYLLATRAAEVRAIDPLVRDSTSLPGLELPLERGMSLRAYIDPASHHIAVSQSRMVNGDDETLFETDYSDFRKVGKVWFAFVEANFASGTPTGTTTIERVVVNPKVVPTDFGPPPEKTHQL